MKKLLLSLVAVTLAACSDAPPPPPQFTISFADKPVYNLYASKIEIVEDYQSTFRYPNVEHQFTITPAEGVRIWARDRLRAAGNDNIVEVIIKDASVVEKPLHTNKGIKGAFTNEQSANYEGRIAVEIKLFEAAKMIPTATVNVNVGKSMTLAENASPRDREQLYNTLTRDMMTALDAQLSRNLETYFQNFFAQ